MKYFRLSEVVAPRTRLTNVNLSLISSICLSCTSTEINRVYTIYEYSPSKWNLYPNMIVLAYIKMMVKSGLETSNLKSLP